MPNQPSPQPSAPRKANASEALSPSDLSKEGWIRELHPSTCLIQAGSAPYALLMTMPIWPRAKTTAELRDSFKESATALGLYDEANPHAEANYTRAARVAFCFAARWAIDRLTASPPRSMPRCVIRRNTKALHWPMPCVPR